MRARPLFLLSDKLSYDMYILPPGMHLRQFRSLVEGAWASNEAVLLVLDSKRPARSTPTHTRLCLLGCALSLGVLRCSIKASKLSTGTRVS